MNNSFSMILQLLTSLLVVVLTISSALGCFRLRGYRDLNRATYCENPAGLKRTTVNN